MNVSTNSERQQAGEPADASLDAALAYVAHGWPVFPCHGPGKNGSACSCGKKDCDSPAKHPRTPNGLCDATTNPDQVKRWNWRNANIGIATGAAAGVWVLDVDPRHGGDKTLAELERENGQLPTTVEAVTGGEHHGVRGRHYFFRHPGVKVTSRKIGPGLDVKGDGGYVVAAPSIHANGNAYRWEPAHGSDDVQIAEAPQWLLELVLRKADATPPAVRPQGPDSSDLDALLEAAQRYTMRAKPVDEGVRNDAAFSLAGHLAAFLVEGSGLRLTEDQILDLVRLWNHRNQPPLAEPELARTVHSAFIGNGTPRPDHVVRQRRREGKTKRQAGQDSKEIQMASKPEASFAPDLMADPRDVGRVKALADEITKSDSFAQDAGGKLFVFDSGVYKPDGMEAVRRRVKRLCNKRAMTSDWTPKLAKDVAEYIRVDAPRLWDRPRLDVINVRNGLLRVADRVLLPHSPEHLSPIRLPVDFDEAARCPKIERFVADVFPGDSTNLAWEVPAWLMRPDTAIQKAVLLVGEGSNGKSTWLRLLIAFLGNRNVSALSLHKLEGDRFAAARLLGKLANICPDLPSAHLCSTSTFKAITGGDSLPAERKFCDSFDFVPFARLVFSANQFPRSGDPSHAFYRRWIVVPFERTFGPGDARPSNELDAELSTAAELSGLLNKALDALPRLTRDGQFTQSESVRRALQEFRETTDPLAVWLDREVADDPAKFIEKARLMKAFNDAAAKAGRLSMNQTAFGRALTVLRPALKDGQRMIGGKVAWCYLGIRLRTSDDV